MMTTKDPRSARRDRIILWAATPLGVLLFVTTRFGNALGITVLPFDPHHILGQLGGLALIIYGLAHWR